MHEDRIFGSETASTVSGLCRFCDVEIDRRCSAPAPPKDREGEVIDADHSIDTWLTNIHHEVDIALRLAESARFKLCHGETDTTKASAYQSGVRGSLRRLFYKTVLLHEHLAALDGDL